MTILPARRAAVLAMLLSPLTLHAFDSGSTGADGAFSPGADVQVPLPPSGIFNFTDVTIPAGVTVTFARNAANTPVRILATGNVTIDGTLSVAGGRGGPNRDGSPGIGGPGGFDGGRGGLFQLSGVPQGGNGLGPGRGEGGADCTNCNAGGGGFGTRGADGNVLDGQGEGGPAYGNPELLPLIGGSGGGGGAGRALIAPGGGGGGGALLIAASGTVTVNGTVSADGGPGGNMVLFSGGASGAGGFGSGGAIRIVASILQGNGTVTARGSNSGGLGRIRLEAESMLRTAPTTPLFSFGAPGVVVLADPPSLRIASVGGVAAPASPAGTRDVVLPGITSNPVEVVVETRNVPLGTVVTLTAAPERGTAITAAGGGVAGTLIAGSDTVSIALPNGNSTLSASASVTLTAALGDRFAPFAGGERVARLELSDLPGAGPSTTYVTVTGRRFVWTSGAVR